MLRRTYILADSHKNPATVLLTMAVVGGMLGVAGLPAYATITAESAATAEPVSDADAQSVSVSSRVDPLASNRDAFSATTSEELAANRAAEARAAAAAVVSSYVYTFSGPRQAGDDYPFYGVEGLSPLRYYGGECVDFVAWRLNRDVGSTSAPFRWDWSNLTPGGGSAVSWQRAWESHGWPVSSTPVPGSVAVIGYNHVAYVNSVNADGTVFLEEYNYGNYHQYSTRTVPASAVTAFLYPPG